MLASLSAPRAARPGMSCALCHRPRTSLATNPLQVDAVGAVDPVDSAVAGRRARQAADERALALIKRGQAGQPLGRWGWCGFAARIGAVLRG